jgi:cobalt-zinc-cadmium efflux system outer membrane protein
MEEAISRALEASPEIKALEAAVREQSALVDQAGRWSNPALYLGGENFAGRGDYSGTELAEYTAAIDQTIETGGKRGRRQDLARSALKQSELQLSVNRGTAVAEARRRYTALQLAQAKQNNARRLLETSQSAADVVLTKRGVGVVGGLDESRTRVTVSLAEIELARTSRDLELARERLVRLWDGHASEMKGDLPALELITPSTDPAALLSRLQSGLRWKWTESLRTSEEHRGELARAEAWPDLSLILGHRWFGDNVADAWIAGVTIPIPVLNQNRDGIRAAREGLQRVNAEVSAVRRGLRDALESNLARVKAAHEAALRLENETLPLARKSHSLVEEGYRLGRYDLLYMLEAQQTLFEVEAGLVAALGELHFAQIDLDELLGPVSPATDQTSGQNSHKNQK